MATRAVGSNLRFSNPLLLPGQDPNFPAGGGTAADPQGFDLGDAVLGSQLVRYLSALGGVQPYIFTSANAAGLTLDPTGRLSGTLPSAGSIPTTFNAAVTDTAGATRTGYFRLGTQTAGEFRFALDRLPAAQIGFDYITNLEVLGGNASNTIFSVVSGSVLLNGTAVTNLETLGFTLSADGTLAGRPLSAGTVSFTAQAVRAGSRALNRAGATFDQPLTIAVAAQDVVESVCGTLTASVKGGRAGRDSLTFSALINTDGLSALDFAGEQFVVRFGGATFTTTLDSSGQARKGDLRVALKAPSGNLKVTLRKQDFTRLFSAGALVNRGTKIAVLQVQIGRNFLGVEPLEFGVRSRGSGFQLAYKLGKNAQIAGLFQITGLQAADFSDGTAFKFRFMISNVAGATHELFGVPTQASIFIGPNFSETVPLSTGRRTGFSQNISKLVIDTKKRFGELVTFALPQSQTGIPPATHTGGRQQTFLFGLDLLTSQRPFSGDCSRRIIPFGFFR